MTYQFWLPFVLLWVLVIFLDRRYSLLRDISAATPKPYSWSRVQLAWWTNIVLSAFIGIVWQDMQLHPPANIPSLHYSTLVLLGISAGTTTVARLIDVSDITDKNPTPRHQDLPDAASNFLLDILSDDNGVSIHRLQAVVFNLVFGIWFIGVVLFNLDPGHNPCSLYDATDKIAPLCAAHPIDYIMPVISDNNLILLGLSSATYAAVKTSENKAPVPPPPPAIIPGTTTTVTPVIPPTPATVTTTISNP